MPNNLGADLTKSIAVMEVLLDDLKKFHGRQDAIKRGLRKNRSYTESLGKDISKVYLDAAALAGELDDLKEKILTVTPKSDPRFDTVKTAKVVSQRIITNFLTRSE